MNIYEKDICEIILNDEFIFDLCKDEWFKLNDNYNYSPSATFEIFSDYLYEHFYEFVVTDSTKVLHPLLSHLICYMNFREVADYVIDFF